MSIDFDKISDDWPVDRVLRERFGVRIRNNAYKCPLHDDRTASASVYRAKDGRLRWRCHVCDKGGDGLDLVRYAQGIDDRKAQIEWLTGSEPPRARPDAPKRQPPEGMEIAITDYALIPYERLREIKVGQTTPPLLHGNGKRIAYTPELKHVYVTTQGVPLAIVLRYRRHDGKKAFAPARWSLSQQWVAILGKDQPMPLYGALRLAKFPAKPVLVLEGEKGVDLVQPFLPDWVVTTWMGGSNKAKAQDFAQLDGRDVTFWPDADEPGIKGMREAMKACAKAANRWWIEPLEEWKAKGNGYDIADWMDEGHTSHELVELIGELRQEQERGEPPDPKDLPPEIRELGGEIRWVMTVMADGQGGFREGIAKRDETNLWLWIKHHPSFKGRLTYDVFTKEVRLDNRPVDYETGSWNDVAHEIAVPRILAGVKPAMVAEKAAQVARLHEVNPLAEELLALAWDKQERHLTDYAGVEPGPWPHCAGRRWLLGLVHRILKPGWKHDGMLVLEGKQGVGKSRFFEIVGQICGRNLHAELGKLTQDADCQMKLAGKAVVELSEMMAHRTGETDALKAMLTSTTDIYRRPYARAHEEVPRTCVFAGSTNQKRWLKDRTGNRRYWVVRVTGPMRLKELADDMPQLLAETVWRIVNDNERNWLEGEEIAWQAEATSGRMMEPGWIDQLEELVRSLETSGDGVVWCKSLWELLAVPPAQQRLIGQELAEVMHARGYEQGQWHQRRDSKPRASNARSWRRVGVDPNADDDIPS